MNEEKFINRKQAVKLLECLGDNYTIIKNPDYIHPEFEICPLAEKIYKVENNILAFVMDMDGTTTTTEVLCLHSLEYMVRLLSGRMSLEEWSGLDQINDYPHIIGNSTTKHVEFLIKKYEANFRKEYIIRSFIHAALYTLINGEDEKRKEEVKNNIINLNLSAILSDPAFIDLTSNSGPFKITSKIINILSLKYSSDFNAEDFNSLVRVGIDVYYQRYHEILDKIKNGNGFNVSSEIFADPDKHLIEPMPGVMIFLSLIKGWLAKEDIPCLIPSLLEDYRKKTNKVLEGVNLEEIQYDLQNLVEMYKKMPAKTALVTSSIFYEADIVMKELMKMILTQIEATNLQAEKKEYLKEKFKNYNNVYDAIITASDSSEIRLKPYRDLYCIALHKLHISKKDFPRVAGFEDSESGTIAIRTAGIGLCVALPFAQTKQHNLKAASHICEGGLPEVLLRYKLFQTNYN